MSDVIDIKVIVQVKLAAVVDNGEPLLKQAEELIKDFGLELCSEPIALHAQKYGEE